MVLINIWIITDWNTTNIFLWA